jgi:hypothetical protein
VGEVGALVRAPPREGEDATLGADDTDSRRHPAHLTDREVAQIDDGDGH